MLHYVLWLRRAEQVVLSVFLEKIFACGGLKTQLMKAAREVENNGGERLKLSELESRMMNVFEFIASGLHCSLYEVFQETG